MDSIAAWCLVDILTDMEDFFTMMIFAIKEMVLILVGIMSTMKACSSGVVFTEKEHYYAKKDYLLDSLILIASQERMALDLKR